MCIYCSYIYIKLTLIILSNKPTDYVYDNTYDTKLPKPLKPFTALATQQTRGPWATSLT